MSNSSLVNYTQLSPNNSGQRTHAIDRITPHCVVGQLSVESMGGWFAQTSARMVVQDLQLSRKIEAGVLVQDRMISAPSRSSVRRIRLILMRLTIRFITN